MLNRLLCRIGLHRWEFKTTYRNEPTYTDVTVSARCWRRCRRFGRWAAVNTERRPW